MGRLVSANEVRSFTNHREDKDPMVETIIKGLERAVEKYTHRRFSPDPVLAANDADTNPMVTKRFATRGQARVALPDLRVVGTVTLSGSAITEAADDFSLSAPNDDEPYTLIELGYYTIPGGLNLSPSTKDLVITGRWGFSPTPDDIKYLMTQLVARAYKKREVNYADMIQQGPEGPLYRYFKSLPEELKMIVENYRQNAPRIAAV